MAYTDCEIQLLHFISVEIKREPDLNIFRLDNFKEIAEVLGIETKGFDAGWQSLISRGYLNHLADQVAAVTPQGLREFPRFGDSGHGCAALASTSTPARH